MPPESVVLVMPGINAWMPPAFRELGIAARTSLLTVCCTFALCTSTIGVSPVTVIVSSSAPTPFVAFAVSRISRRNASNLASIGFG